MTKRIPHYFLKFFLVIIFFLVFARVGQARLRIVTSIFPLEEFASAVVGSEGDVSCLLPPGAEIHSWKPRPSDIVRLSDADLFIYNGAGLEPWMADLLKSLNRPQLRILEAAAGLPSLHRGENEEKHHDEIGQGGHEHGGIDPHVWLDFEYDQVLIDGILSLVVEMNPEGAVGYRRRAEDYKAALAQLDDLYRKSLLNTAGKTFIFGGHAAFGRLAERYGLQQISLYGLSPNARPRPKHMAEITNLARKNNIRVIFFEPFVSPDLARVIADEVDAEVRVLYPGANRTLNQVKEKVTFLQLMRMNLENLCYGLNRK